MTPLSSDDEDSPHAIFLQDIWGLIVNFWHILVSRSARNICNLYGEIRRSGQHNDTQVYPFPPLYFLFFTLFADAEIWLMLMLMPKYCKRKIIFHGWKVVLNKLKRTEEILHSIDHVNAAKSKSFLTCQFLSFFSPFEIIAHWIFLDVKISWEGSINANIHISFLHHHDANG